MNTPAAPDPSPPLSSAGLKTDFLLLSEFLDRCDQDVQGRALEFLPDELRLRLHRFAQGQLDAPGRLELAEFLKNNPGWVEQLAAEVKSLRSQNSRTTEPAP